VGAFHYICPLAASGEWRVERVQGLLKKPAAILAINARVVPPVCRELIFDAQSSRLHVGDYVKNKRVRGKKIVDFLGQLVYFTYNYFIYKIFLQ